jgi:uncharacterized protein involved in outer membrane biogenesis/cell division septum initiation protein DivIVA
MKKIAKITGIVILVILILAIFTPLIFKNRIIAVVKKEANQSLNATFDFKNVKLSLIRDFPNLSVRINDLSVVGKGLFDGDTLVYLPGLNLTLNLLSVIRGDTYDIRKIQLLEPQIHLVVLEDGQASWNIAKMEEAAPPPGEAAAPSTYKIALKKFEIRQGRIGYDDRQIKTLVDIRGLDHVLSGRLTADSTTLSTVTHIAGLTVDYDGIRYLNRAMLDLKADIDADLAASRYSVRNGSLRLNDLVLALDGSVAMPAEGYDIDLSFATSKTDFKSLLSLIPAIYQKDFKGVEATGMVTIGGHIKGIYNDTHYPSFSLQLVVENGSFKYPSLPVGVTGIAIRADITNPGGDLDNTTVAVDRFHLAIAQNPLDIRFILKTPVSDPWLDVSLQGTYDLGRTKDIYPIGAGNDLEGLISVDAGFKGHLSALENNRYDQFEAHGYLTADHALVSSSMLPGLLAITGMRLEFTPAAAALKSAAFRIERNDISANGTIRNYIPYLLKGDTISGQLAVQSHFMNLNDFLAEDTTATATPVTPGADTTTALTVFEVPGNVDLVLSSSFDKLVYQKMEMTDVKGTLRITGRQVLLDNLTMNMLGGGLAVSGSYDTRDVKKPAVNLHLNVSNLDIPGTWSTVGLFQRYAPVAEKMKGTFSSEVSYSSLLDSAMMPDYSTMTGSGRLTTSVITVQDLVTMNKIADILTLDKLKKLTLDKVNISFEFVNGKVIVKPFTFKLDRIRVQVGGSTSHKGGLDYLMHMAIHKSVFGQEINRVISNLMGKVKEQVPALTPGDSVKVDVMIGGTVKEPTVKVGLKESMNDEVKKLKKAAEEELRKQKEELEQKAREEANQALADAQVQADRIMEEAGKKAEAIKATARQTSDKMKKDADTNAENLIAEGKKKGPLAELAARKSAEEMKKTTYKKADQLVQEADKQAAAVMQEAKAKADKILSDARQKVNK